MEDPPATELTVGGGGDSFCAFAGVEELRLFRRLKRSCDPVRLKGTFFIKDPLWLSDMDLLTAAEASLLLLLRKHISSFNGSTDSASEDPVDSAPEL